MPVKSKVKISENFVAFSEYRNFKSLHYLKVVNHLTGASQFFICPDGCTEQHKLLRRDHQMFFFSVPAHRILILPKTQLFNHSMLSFHYFVVPSNGLFCSRIYFCGLISLILMWNCSSIGFYHRLVFAKVSGYHWTERLKKWHKALTISDSVFLI